jgi:hypothetical protein
MVGMQRSPGALLAERDARLGEERARSPWLSCDARRMRRALAHLPHPDRVIADVGRVAARAYARWLLARADEVGP